MPGGHGAHSPRDRLRPRENLMDTLQRRATPPNKRLHVPAYVRAAGGVLGACTAALGVIYLVVPPERPPEVAAYSVVGILEPAFGVAFVLVGAVCIMTAVASAARASAHGVAAVLHGGYVLALGAQVVLVHPFRPTVTLVLSVIALVAHGGASLAFWQRGWR